MELTRDQLQARKDKAVRFTRDVLGDPDRAEEIADESLDDYAERRHIRYDLLERACNVLATVPTPNPSLVAMARMLSPPGRAGWPRCRG
jgi:hypothetical protein